MTAPLLPTNHNMHRRAKSHDYSRRGTYMVTLVANNRQAVFGSLDCERAKVVLSPFGEAIAKDEIRKINLYYPSVRVWKLCVMPDHLHMILHVGQDLPEGRNLGKIIAGFKQGCYRAYRQITGEEMSVFMAGYNDKILYDDGQLERWKAYLDDNPRRLAIKRLHPDFFNTKRPKVIADRECEIYGNEFLLNIPDKVAVVVHRRDDEATFNCNRERWLACGERGGVIVGTGISPREKMVMREAMNRGYAIILLRQMGFPVIYKPSGEAFDSCAHGKLLQISPWPYSTRHAVITREQCLELNRIAEAIAKG